MYFNLKINSVPNSLVNFPITRKGSLLTPPPVYPLSSGFYNQSGVITERILIISFYVTKHYDLIVSYFYLYISELQVSK